MKQFKKLPADIQELCRAQQVLFRQNWKHPKLHTKKLKGHQSAFSIRITRAYRAIFFFAEEDVVMFASIGHRKDAYR